VGTVDSERDVITGRTRKNFVPRRERLYLWFGEPIDTTDSPAKTTTRPPAGSVTKSSSRSRQVSSSCATSATRRIPIVISPSAFSAAPSNALHHQYGPARHHAFRPRPTARCAGKIGT
jgi:hypothetical protein